MFRVKELAQRKGLNITTLANRANMPRGQVLRVWRNAADRPSIGTLERIAEALEVPIWALYEDAPDPTEIAV